MNITGYLKFNLAASSAGFFQIDKNNYRTMFFWSKQVCLPKISLIVQKKKKSAQKALTFLHESLQLYILISGRDEQADCCKTCWNKSGWWICGNWMGRYWTVHNELDNACYLNTLDKMKCTSLREVWKLNFCNRVQQSFSLWSATSIGWTLKYTI